LDAENWTTAAQCQTAVESALDDADARAYGGVVTTRPNVGLEVSTIDTEQGNIELIVQNLESRRDEISGVDINEEAAELLIYEQMFQAMAKYISTIQTSMESLMEIL
jgi:flagellar hook-associated protein 1 FlgK